MPSAPIMAGSKAISATPWASADGNAQRFKRATWSPEIAVPPKAADKVASGRRFHFGIEVRDDVLECRDRLLNRGDLHQFPGTDRAVAILQGDNQIPPLLLELNKRQTVVRQMSHHGGSHPLDRTTVRYSGVVLPLAYKTPANFNELAQARGSSTRRSPPPPPARSLGTAPSSRNSYSNRSGEDRPPN